MFNTAGEYYTPDGSTKKKTSNNSDTPPNPKHFSFFFLSIPEISTQCSYSTRDARKSSCLCRYLIAFHSFFFTFLIPSKNGDMSYEPVGLFNEQISKSGLEVRVAFFCCLFTLIVGRARVWRKNTEDIGNYLLVRVSKFEFPIFGRQFWLKFSNFFDAQIRDFSKTANIKFYCSGNSG